MEPSEVILHSCEKEMVLEKNANHITTHQMTRRLIGHMEHTAEIDWPQFTINVMQGYL